MKIKSIILGLVVTSGLIVINNNSHNISAQGAEEPCQANINISMPNNGDSISNNSPVRLDGDGSIVKVTFLVDGDVLGKGKRDVSNANSNQWFMPWNTWYSQPGSRMLTARAMHNDGRVCLTNPVNVIINNPHQEPLHATLLPSNMNLQTNDVAFFVVDFEEATTTGSVNSAEFAFVSWSVSGRGYVTPELDSNARYNSGSKEGNGTVKAIVYYGGEQVTVQSSVFVDSPYIETDNSTDPPTTSNNAPSTSGSNNTEPITEDEDHNNFDNSGEGFFEPNDVGEFRVEQTFKPSEIASRITESDNPVDVCILDRLGEDTLHRMSEENRSPSGDEFDRYLDCFSRQNYIMPSTFVPVPPSDVLDKRVTSRVEIRHIGNEETVEQEDGSRKKALVFSGVTTPDTNVLIYIFSEPLVLATTSDSNGNWSYTLEDPITSGEHEVYALVEKGDGEYERSDFASIFIGTAEATEENPNGFSLELIAEPTISASNRTVNLFIASTIGMVTFVSVLLFSYWYQNKRYPETYGSQDNSNVSQTGAEPTKFHETL